MCDCPKKPKTEIVKQCSRPLRKKLPNREKELEIAKAILQRRSNYTGDNVFDHLSDLIKRIIDEDPPNVADYFDEYSRIVREEKFHMTENNLISTYREPINLQYASNTMKALELSLYPKMPTYGEEEEFETDVSKELEVTPSMKDILQYQYYWNLCGIGIDKDCYLLSYSIEKFQKHPAISSCRFWGKLFGLKKNYYVLEVTFKSEEVSARLEQMKYELMAKSRQSKEKNYADLNFHTDRLDLVPGTNWQHFPAPDLAKMNMNQPKLPKTDYESAADIPPEIVGKGLNRYAYFVCNDPLEEWVELPIVTPAQITLSRVIKKFLTGNLEAHIVSYPSFPGREKHFLRAMIARISASTHICPSGYMVGGKMKTAGGEEEEEEEEEAEEEEEYEEDDGKGKKDNDKPLIENVKYKPHPIRKLLELESWQHFKPAILTQGRIVAYDEKKYRKELGLGAEGENAEEEGEEEVEEEEEEDDEEEDKAKSKKEPLELGPQLFRPCSEDRADSLIPPWTIQKVNHINTNNIMVMVRSNLWPGAYAISMQNVVDLIYVGWGQKFEARNNSPKPLPDIQQEYPIGPEILEILDPSVKDEEDWRIAHTKVEKKDEDMEYEGKGEGEEGDDEEGEEEEDEN